MQRKYARNAAHQYWRRIEYNHAIRIPLRDFGGKLLHFVAREQLGRKLMRSARR